MVGPWCLLCAQSLVPHGCLCAEFSAPDSGWLLCVCGWDRRDSADAGLEREDREWPLLPPAPAGTAQWDGPYAELWEDGDEVRDSPGGRINK